MNLSYQSYHFITTVQFCFHFSYMLLLSNILHFYLFHDQQCNLCIYLYIYISTYMYIYIYIPLFWASLVAQVVEICLLEM